jgi:hypothetical protein
MGRKRRRRRLARSIGPAWKGRSRRRLERDNTLDKPHAGKLIGEFSGDAHALLARDAADPRVLEVRQRNNIDEFHSTFSEGKSGNGQGEPFPPSTHSLRQKEPLMNAAGR